MFRTLPFISDTINSILIYIYGSYNIVIYTESSNLFTYQAEKAVRSDQGGDVGKASLDPDRAGVYPMDQKVYPLSWKKASE